MKEEASHIIKANPVVISKPFQPVIKHREIKPLDFKLPGDEISEKKKLKFEEEQRAKNQSKFEFKAQPLRIVEDGPVSYHARVLLY